MPAAVLERTCRSIGDRPVQLEISAYGETFQHPDADRLISKARDLCPKAQIIVATNGALLDKERCRRLIDSGIDHLSFSLDAGSAKSHRWLTGVNNYDTICRNLERRVELRDRRGGHHLKITTHIIGIQELATEFDTFIARCSPVVDHAYVRTFGNWAGLVDDNGVTPYEKQPIPEVRYPCAWLWYAAKIQPNGDVSKCFVHVTGDANPLGNIMKERLSSIWHGENMGRLREQHCTNDLTKIEHCPDCIVWSLFPHFWIRCPDDNRGFRWK
jgi:radical SAM protein with 4Fe4S-binding SPASM domain